MYVHVCVLIYVCADTCKTMSILINMPSALAVFEGMELETEFILVQKCEMLVRVVHKFLGKYGLGKSKNCVNFSA